MTSHCIVSGAANWDLTLFRTDFIRLCCIAAPHSDFDTGQLIDTYNGITSNNEVWEKSISIHPKYIHSVDPMIDLWTAHIVHVRTKTEVCGSNNGQAKCFFTIPNTDPDRNTDTIADL